jgi:two-component system phosphate regulon sensor histidine kinase PhoR
LRFRSPANVLLRRAQIVLILAALLPTILTTPIGIALLVVGSSRALAVVGGLLVIAFCTSSLTGYILGSIFVSRGASLAKVQQDFLSSVSHELMTPITSVRLFIDTLRDERVTDPEEKRKCLDIIDREMKRLDVLVTKLIDLSRLESGKQPFETKPVLVQEIVDEALVAFDAAVMSNPVDLDVAVTPEVTVMGDRALLGQALANLMINAWKYGGQPEKRIKVAAAARGRGEVAIEVTDNGPGIPDAERRRIFEEFERGKAAEQTRARGAGLGLAIVRAIVRAHRGRVEVESEVGQGSIFRIFLPVPRRLPVPGRLPI